MPLPLTVSWFSKIQIGFTFLVPAHPGSPEKRVCVCVHASHATQSPALHAMRALRKDVTQHMQCSVLVKFSHVAGKQLAFNYLQVFCLWCAWCVRCILLKTMLYALILAAKSSSRSSILFSETASMSLGILVTKFVISYILRYKTVDTSGRHMAQYLCLCNDVKHGLS